MAAESNKLDIATQVKCPPHKFYEMIKYTLHHLPLVFPETYKTSEILEGDGESVGTVRLWKYVLPGTTEVLSCKEKVELIDDENMWVVLNIFEGDLAIHYQSFLVKIHVIPQNEGCSVKWSVEYGKCSEGISDPHHYLDLFAMINDKLAAHIAAKA
ncbi:Mlp-like protein [Thalictrum thalictroides]|uniref:Mlp-like protein n=1 Tax=Thalictrum thalictroides TaxID=46969 RepID=A0A7J6V565_THATH|nr:Mlp-like protein [Thalictrum thalictroides]